MTIADVRERVTPNVSGIARSLKISLNLGTCPHLVEIGEANLRAVMEVLRAIHPTLPYQVMDAIYSEWKNTP